MIHPEFKFLMSNTDFNKCPKPDKPEFAFIGRSNVGKSSLINALANKKELAHTSSKPGKTQHINHYLVNDSWFLVDLPGYGYAKTSKKNRGKFKGMMYHYLESRPNLISVFLLIDSRIPPQKIDMEFMRWMAEHAVPFTMCFTKTDKLKPEEWDENLKTYIAKMEEDWAILPEYIVTSAFNKEGLEDVFSKVEELSVHFQA